MIVSIHRPLLSQEADIYQYEGVDYWGDQPEGEGSEVEELVVEPEMIERGLSKGAAH